MKKEDIDLRALENADEETIEKLSALPCPVSEADRDRLFEKCEKRTAGGGIIRTETANVVTGVETYRRPLWRRVLAIASALVLTAGVCTGGALLLKGFRSGDVVDPTAATEATSYTAKVDLVSAAPFGDISCGRVRFMTTAYSTYVYDTFSDATAPELAEAFNHAEWEALPVESDMPDGERTYVYVDDAGRRFSLAFCGGTVEYKREGSITLYKVSEEVSALVNRLANPAEPDALQGHLIWCKTKDLNADGVWKNNEPVPETIFEQASVPSGLKGMNITDSYPLYDYAYDIHDINENAKNADDLITGKVEEISYRVQKAESSFGTPDTIITVTVTGDTAGRYSSGDKVDIATAGGFISLRDMMGDQLYMTGGKYGSGLAMTEEEIDNTYYHEIVESGEVPIVGKEYAFFVADDTSGGLTSVGFEYGMLYKCDNLYIQRNEYGFRFYEMNELRAMMGLPAEPEETAADDNDTDWGIDMELSNVNPRSAELTITRSSTGNPKGTLETGRVFYIERMTDDGWEKIASRGNAVFTTEALYIPTADEPLVMTQDWEYLYGELSTGKYRLVKSVMDYIAPGEFEEREYYLPFEIGEDVEETSASEIVPAEESDKYGIAMAITDVTPRGARLTVFRDRSGSEAGVSTGSDYWIERQTEDGWEQMPGRNKIIFPLDTYDIPVGGRLSFDVTWNWIFGELEPGNYRFVKRVYDNDRTVGSEDHIIPFTLEEGAVADDTTFSTDRNVTLFSVGSDLRDTKLVRVIGDNGKEGFIYDSEMPGHDSISTPQEAMAYMESIKNGTYQPKVINVYAQDGVTVIDTMTEQLN